MPDIEYYYDFRSPYAYFAASRMGLLTATGAQIVWRPVSVDVLLCLQQGQEPWSDYADPFCPPKRAHFMADIFRLIEYWNIPFAMPSPPVPDARSAMAIAALLEREGVSRSAFHDCVYRAIWLDQKDAQDPEVLRACLTAGGHDPALIERAETEGRALLTGNTLALYERGVFGVPTFIHGENLYFGADRMEMIASHYSAKIA